VNIDLDTVLRSMDAAGPPATGLDSRAAATLERIVSTPAVRPAETAPSRFRLKGRLVLATAVVAAMAGAVAVFPGLTSGSRAYASWTPVPTTLTPAEIDRIGPPCREALHDGESLDAGRARLALAERRGEYAVLLYRTENPDMSGACLAYNPPGSDDVDDLQAAVGGGSGPALAVSGQQFTQGAIADFGDASVTDGAVGPDVAAVTLHAAGRTVQASVADGRYVAWWPGPAMSSDGNTDPRVIITYDLTLRSGEVLENATPHLPR
jgi:hypothetical protein